MISKLKDKLIHMLGGTTILEDIKDSTPKFVVNTERPIVKLSAIVIVTHEEERYLRAKLSDEEFKREIKKRMLYSLNDELLNYIKIDTKIEYVDLTPSDAYRGALMVVNKGDEQCE